MWRRSNFPDVDYLVKDVNRLHTEDLTRRVFAADECLIRPGVIPVSVASAIKNTLLIEKAVNCLDRCGTIQVVDHIRIAVIEVSWEKDAVPFTDETATP